MFSLPGRNQESNAGRETAAKANLVRDGLLGIKVCSEAVEIRPKKQISRCLGSAVEMGERGPIIAVMKSVGLRSHDCGEEGRESTEEHFAAVKGRYWYPHGDGKGRKNGPCVLSVEVESVG